MGAEEDLLIGHLIGLHFFPRKEGQTMLMGQQCMNEIIEILKTCDEGQLNEILEDLKAGWIHGTHCCSPA